MPTAEEIKARLMEALQPESCEVIAISEEQAKYDVNIVAAAFQGVPLIQRHRMVNNLFEKELLSGEIHALTIRAKPPAAAAAPPAA